MVAFFVADSTRFFQYLTFPSGLLFTPLFFVANLGSPKFSRDFSICYKYWIFRFCYKFSKVEKKGFATNFPKSKKRLCYKETKTEKKGFATKNLTFTLERFGQTNRFRVGEPIPLPNMGCHRLAWYAHTMQSPLMNPDFGICCLSIFLCCPCLPE